MAERPYDETPQADFPLPLQAMAWLAAGTAFGGQVGPLASAAAVAAGQTLVEENVEGGAVDTEGDPDQTTTNPMIEP